MVGARSMTDLEKHATDPYAHQIAVPSGDVTEGAVFRLIATGNIFGPSTAGNDVLTGDYNFAAGDTSLAAITSGSEIVSIGRKTLSAVTEAAYITAVGNSALEVYDDTSALAGYVTAYGFYAGKSLTEGDYATIIGAYACYNAIAVGEGDIYIGAYCGSAVVSTAGSNLAMMAGAMSHADGACHGNICIGPDAGDNLTDGDHNLFGGEFSGTNIADGDDNTLWGNLSGVGFTGASTGNVALGNGAGPSTSGVYDDTLWIDNHATDTPLIEGDFAAHTFHINGTLSKTAGAFKIDHPLDGSKHLVHGFIEGAEYGLLYRGEIMLTDGKATVDIDEACGMSKGIFEAIAQNPTVYLQNKTGFNSVMGKVENSTIYIRSYPACDNVISWLVCAERKDKFVMECAQTDDKGHLILELGRSDNGAPTSSQIIRRHS